MKSKINYAHSDHNEYDLSRIITLNDDINSNIVGEIITTILKINEEDSKFEREYKDYQREPIKLIIISYGGTVYDGLGLIDCMDQSKTPIHTICYGSAMSMAMIILCCGHQRFAGKYSTIMYHEAAYNNEGKVESHKQELKEVERTENICDEILLERTKLNKRAIKKIKESRGEWYITAKEALDMKLIDKIL